MASDEESFVALQETVVRLEKQVAQTQAALRTAHGRIDTLDQAQQESALQQVEENLPAEDPYHIQMLEETDWIYCTGEMMPPPEAQVWEATGTGNCNYATQAPFDTGRVRVVWRMEWDAGCLWEHYYWIYFRGGKIIKIDGCQDGKTGNIVCRKLIVCAEDCEEPTGG